MKEWAAFFSGDYDGHFCNSPGDWEDMIGTVALRCVPAKDGILSVAIKSLELSGWTGTLHVKDKVLTVFTKRKGTPFQCRFLESSDGRGGSFAGEFPKGRGRRVVKLSLTMRRLSRPPR